MTAKRPPANNRPAPPVSRARACDAIAFLMLAALVALRPLVLESYDSASSPMTDALGTFSDPSPVRTLAFDLLILVATTLWLLGRTFDPARRPYRWTGLEIGTVLIVVAAVVSSLVAGNQRVAINASLDFCCLPILAIALANLLGRHPGYRPILLAAILASGVVQAVQCMEQYLGQEATIANYEENKEVFWAQQGVALDSSQVEMFERRMLARETAGFLSHPGVAGSHLAMGVLVALAMLVPRSPPPANGPHLIHPVLPRIGQAVLVLVLVAGLLLTRSRGAVAGAAFGLLAWGLLHCMRHRLAAHPQRWLIVGWVVAAAGLAAVVGHGLYHGSLPGASLDFRWKYWETSTNLVADHALTGVGRENFRDHYTAYKTIDSPEEIANPHNLIVQAAADWGLLGLAGLVAMMLGASRTMVRRSDPPAIEPSPTRGQWIVTAAVLLAVVALLRGTLLDTPNGAYVYYVCVTGGLVWMAGFLLFGPGRAAPADRPAPTLVLGIAGALLAFLLHEMINFALFVPGAATVFFALLAVALASPGAATDPVIESRKSRAAGLPSAIAAGLTLLIAFALVRPVWRADGLLQVARRAATTIPPAEPIENHPASDAFVRAAAADPLDPTAPLERGRWLAAVAAITPDQAEGWQRAGAAFQESLDRNPHSLAASRLLARTRARVAIASGRPEDQAAAVEAARQVLTLYPQSPRDLADLGEVLLAAGTRSRDPALLAEAAATARQALELDDQRPDWETIRRLRPRERDRLNDILNRASELEQALQP